MSAKLNEILELIDDLKPEERKILYKRLRDDIRYKMSDILDRVNERAEDAYVSIDEVSKEVDIVRSTKYEKN